jgi:flagellar protein FlgJ
MTPEEYKNAYSPYAKNAESVYGLPAVVMLAQSALETGWGEYVAADDSTGQTSNNFFNIKGARWSGPVIWHATSEFLGGKWHYHLPQPFRVYPSPKESFEDYCRFIMNDSRYAEAVKAREDWERYITEIWAAGYATDPDYVNKVKNIVRRHFL